MEASQEDGLPGSTGEELMDELDSVGAFYDQGLDAYIGALRSRTEERDRLRAMGDVLLSGTSRLNGDLSEIGQALMLALEQRSNTHLPFSISSHFRRRIASLKNDVSAFFTEIAETLLEEGH